MKIKNIVTKITSISEKNKMLILFLVLLSGWFYWFQYRPTVIRRECYEVAIDVAVARIASDANIDFDEADDRYRDMIENSNWWLEGREDHYISCLHKRGLK